MKRRSFIQASIAAACAADAAPVLGAEREGGSMFELRTYSLKAAKLPVLEAYLSKAFMPALKRFGIGPVGVFMEKGEQELLKVYVLIVYSSADQVASLSGRLAADDEYLKAGQPYLAAPASDPIYIRIESSLMVPIEGMPKLEKPDTSKPRLLNLRIYESHNERTAKKKIEML